MRIRRQEVAKRPWRLSGAGRGRVGYLEWVLFEPGVALWAYWLEQIRGGPLTVGELAARLGLTLPTVSGVLADLDRAGLVERRPDPADRRRTIVQIIPGQAALIGHWLDGAAKPLARVLDQLTPAEQQAFLKAMDLLETELHQQDTHG
jgi:DNA-binding MarR family transcriptional regulator